MKFHLIRFYGRTASVALFLAALTGCGGGAVDDHPTLAPVKGKVTLEGQPLANAFVEFSPVTAGGASSGTSGGDGSFTLSYRDGEPGAAVGEHRVTVTAGGPTPEQQTALDAAAEGDRTVEIPKDIPPVKTYTQTATVAEGENDLTIDLKKSNVAGTPRNSAER